jgi:hypothetical protein
VRVVKDIWEEEDAGGKVSFIFKIISVLKKLLFSLLR